MTTINLLFCLLNMRFRSHMRPLFCIGFCLSPLANKHKTKKKSHMSNESLFVFGFLFFYCLLALLFSFFIKQKCDNKTKTKDKRLALENQESLENPKCKLILESFSNAWFSNACFSPFSYFLCPSYANWSSWPLTASSRSFSICLEAVS